MRLRGAFCALVLVVAGSFGAERTPPLSYSEIMGMKLYDGDFSSVWVWDVTPGTPAAQAGILPKDVIIEIDGKPVSNARACGSGISDVVYLRGNSTILTIEREGRRTSATLQPPMVYGRGFEPPPPVPFPPAYKDYQILPGSVSPGNRYVFIYPKRARLYELKKYGLFLASLAPFRILSRLPLGTSNLAGNARCYYAATWAKDASAAVFIAGSKWGPEKVSVVQLRHGKVTQQTELTAAVHKQVLADFKKSHAKRYNDYYDFIFDSEERQTVVDGETLAERGWDLGDAGHVIIDCNCTTDPKQPAPHRWAVRFRGLWDIQSGRFFKKDFTRIPPGRS